MKKLNLLFILIISQFIFGQTDETLKAPVQPLYENGGIENFFQYLTNNLDFTKIEKEKDVMIGFVLDKQGKMNHIKVSFCNNMEAEKEIFSVLQKASDWDLSNQINKDHFICYHIKLIFEDKKVRGASKTMWSKEDIKDVKLTKGDFDYLEKKDTETEKDKLHSIAGIDIQPQFPGGPSAFREFIMKNYRTPNIKGLKELNGRVLVQFVIEKDGSVTDIEVLRDLGYGTGKEAIRVLKKSPNWIPGEINGKKIRCKYSLPLMINIKK